jgi:hypothetical protein
MLQWYQVKTVTYLFSILKYRGFPQKIIKKIIQDGRQEVTWPAKSENITKNIFPQKSNILGIT